MKIAVIGGAGVFGARLARLLRRDGHDVIVAGRSLTPLQTLSSEIGATAMRLDRNGDLAPLWQMQPAAVVDAAGPFHAYGDDPYALPRTCISKGVHYLDLADDADFCTGISALNDAALAAGTFALSGVSSVPAISSAVVADLATGADAIDSIASAILPGNRAPRGRAVVDSILYQAGTPMTHKIDGAAQTRRSWSSPRRFAFAPGQARTGYVIRVPDQSLFPPFFAARSVTFHAGLELGLMNHGLALLSWLRAKTGLRVPAGLVFQAARLLAPFGTNQGGMAVQVVTRSGEDWHLHDWQLHVGSGEGPFVPAIAARTILRDIAAIAPGARPALAEVSLPQITAALSDIDATTRQTTTTLPPLFARVLGNRFADLPAAVRDCHQTFGPRHWTGTAQVDRGQGLWPRLLAALFGFPAAQAATPVTVNKTPQDGAEVWERQFGTRTFQSTLHHGRRGLVERFGPFSFDLDLQVAADALHFPVAGGRFLGIPIPKWMLPRSESRETENPDGTFHFDVALLAPITGGMIVHYRGTLSRPL